MSTCSSAMGASCTFTASTLLKKHLNTKISYVNQINNEWLKFSQIYATKINQKQFSLGFS